jgi:hypothetical protein
MKKEKQGINQERKMGQYTCLQQWADCSSQSSSGKGGIPS